jgi:hypothetical protein
VILGFIKPFSEVFGRIAHYFCRAVVQLRVAMPPPHGARAALAGAMLASLFNFLSIS